MFSGSKYLKNILFNFEKRSTGYHIHDLNKGQQAPGSSVHWDAVKLNSQLLHLDWKPC